MIHTSMIKPLLISAVAAIALACSSFASHVGDSIESVVTFDNKVPLPVQGLTPTEITHIVLDDGVWLVSGQINIFSAHQPTGTLFTAGNISLDEASFDPVAKAAISAERLTVQNNVIRPVALVSRIVEVGHGDTQHEPQNVFLVAGVFNPNANVTGWGFITAVKIRNHAQ